MSKETAIDLMSQGYLLQSKGIPENEYYLYFSSDSKIYSAVNGLKCDVILEDIIIDQFYLGKRYTHLDFLK